ncbi:YhfC family glutamic-type intramembrane protease [Streptococcus salivarius]|uniref:YhfC family glutamic-type intramembrane protease n=1 Tax=Streptococcus salivarius TaxID=1304 RepID=UPI000938A964|nr:YhfC family glutamic-type intramembrane protease [Streptococcus salivarius]
METFLFMTILAMLVIAIISLIILKKKWQFSIKLFLVGLIGFALPVMMIEGPVNAVVFSGFVHSSKWFTIIYGGLMAGLVEETTRYVVFKVLAKKRSLMTSDIVAYGFGHGLSEFILLGVMGLLTYIIVLQAIHSGQTSQLPPLLVSQVKQLTGFAVVMSLFERLVALVLQVLLTAWDFLAVTKHKLSFYFGAILLHATIDFLAGAYQQGIVRNILLIEVMLAIYVLGVGLVTRQIWKKEETHGLI